jgi:hypothetical protein
LGRRSSKAIGGLAFIGHAALPWCSGDAAAAELALEEPCPCITRDELAFRVERLLGQPLAAVEAMQLSVRIGSTPAGFVAELGVTRPNLAEQGVRSLNAAACDALSEALALAIVVAIGADAEAPPPAATPPLPAAPRDEPAPLAVPVVAAESEVAGSGPSLAGVAWMVGDSGTLPVPGLGLGVGVSLVWPGVEVRAVGTWLPKREGTLDATDPSSPGTSIGLVAGSALGCVPVGVDRAIVDVAACVGWELGELSGTGTHVSVPYEQRRLWSAARLDVAARWPVPGTSVGLEVSVAGVVPFTRDDFILKDLGTVHRPASVVGRLGLGISLAVD